MLTGYKKRNNVTITRLINSDTNEVFDTENKVNDVLASNFIVDSDKRISDNVLQENIKEYEDNYCKLDDAEEFQPVLMEEVKQAISEVKEDCSSILFTPLSILKRCTDIVSFQLAIFFNLLFLNCSVPSLFKVTRVTPLYKGKGHKYSPGNYRPISGINVYCKIFEDFISQNAYQNRFETLYSTTWF